ncbi:protein disulfide oxidoreductase [Shewanella waksmanii]|uniref:protein disulfide oxidoreductase n=1 Tax=Shewanella waksmanii TaxID=213783 RepID=UPI0037368F02
MTSQADETTALTWRQRMLSWTKQLVSFLILAVVISAAVDWWRARDFPREQLPSMAAMSLQGEYVDVNALSFEKPVLVYFWGTWCPICSFVSPAVNWMADDYAVVSIAMASGHDAKLTAYLQQQGYRFTTINDNQNQIAQQWSVQLTPTLMVIKDGELKHVTTGFTSLPGMLWRMLLN